MAAFAIDVLVQGHVPRKMFLWINFLFQPDSDCPVFQKFYQTKKLNFSLKDFV